MRQEWSPEELLASWTLVEGDWKVVANKTGVTRLEFWLMLTFFGIEARCPEFIEELPQPAVEFVAGFGPGWLAAGPSAVAPDRRPAPRRWGIAATRSVPPLSTG